MEDYRTYTGGYTIEEERENALLENYEEWREDQFDENFEDICSNLGIEIDDIEPLRKDEVLREIIIEKHDKRYPDTFTVEEYLETLGE